MAVELDALRQTAESVSVERMAKARFTASDSDAAASHAIWRKNMFLYDPPNGDQWPEDMEERPDKVHLSFNIVKPTVDIASRIQSILPRLSLEPANPAEEDSRSVAEVVEKMFYRWLQASDWDLWLNDACRTKSIGGRTFLKPFWNAEEERPDVSVIEQPHRLRIGWTANNYKRMEWAIFEYSISPLEARIRWPHVTVSKSSTNGPFVVEVGDHTDPLDTIPNIGFVGLAPGGGLSSDNPDKDTEQGHLGVWDYWYKRIGDDGKPEICNAILLEGRVVEGPTVHPEYKTIPFIPIENDHRPGSPLGISDIKAIMDIQDALNRNISALTQLAVDNSDPAWQKVGENATDVEPGDVPKANEVVAPGPGNRIERIDTGVNTFPIDQLLGRIWDAFHKITGLTEALFGGIPGSQTSGRALAVQIEGAANRLSPRRDRVYVGLRHLFKMWTDMLIANNATVTIPVAEDEEAQEGEEPRTEETIKLEPILKNVGPWKIIAPEITPRDVTEHIMNNINLVNAKMRSLKAAMDDTGTESPEDMVRDIIEERNNIDLFPADVQTKIAVVNLMTQLGLQQQQMSAQAEAQGAAAEQTQGQMAANPALGPETGGEMAGLPAAQQGAVGGTPLTQQTLLRGDQETGQVQNLQQIAIR